MKVRDSGMPDEVYWESLFDVPRIIDQFQFSCLRDVAELGCGFGTFSIPAAQAIVGKLYAFDIEPEMMERTRARAKAAGIGNLILEERDVLATGFGVQVDAVMLFNILHCEQPTELLQLARQALLPGGRVLVIHWRSDIATPRGPAAEIRPRPADTVAWANAAGLRCEEPVLLPPWHYGLVLQAAEQS